MTIKPILFSGPMVRALLEGRKTQTRRVLNPQPKRGATVFRDGDFWYQETKHGPGSDCIVMDGVDVNYAPGDLLYVREGWRVSADLDNISPADLPRSVSVRYEADGALNSDGCPILNPGRYRQGMHILRRHSRLTLRVTEVRVQRLQEISTDDALAEGIERKRAPGVSSLALMAQGIAKAEFRELWQSLNEKRGFGWDVNPWVTAISFEVIRANVDSIKEQTND